MSPFPVFPEEFSESWSINSLKQKPFKAGWYSVLSVGKS